MIARFDNLENHKTYRIHTMGLVRLKEDLEE